MNQSLFSILRSSSYVFRRYRFGIFSLQCSLHSLDSLCSKTVNGKPASLNITSVSSSLVHNHSGNDEETNIYSQRSDSQASNSVNQVKSPTAHTMNDNSLIRTVESTVSTIATLRSKIENLLTISRHGNSSNDSNQSLWLYSILAIFLSSYYMLKDIYESNLSFKNTSLYNQMIARCDMDGDCGVNYSQEQVLTNWSNTHINHPSRIYYPTSAQQVSRVLKLYHDKKLTIRPIGTGLSPNGIGFASSSSGSLMNLVHIDHIQIDSERKLVTVGAGATVRDVLLTLSKYGLTLQNFSSIQEQQIGGWTQVSAHGTGCKLSTVDDMIVSMTVAIPTGGLLTLSESNNPQLFNMMKVGLGSLGVVTELTLKCMPSMKLKEELTVLNSTNIAENHLDRLRKYRHVRYMWLPYTDYVVNVVSNPTDESISESLPRSTSLPTKPLVDLLLSIDPKFSLAEASKLSFSQLRDILLGHDPLNVEHIKRVNIAEGQFWLNSTGSRVDDSTHILGFDCGGEQWVLEICIPMGSIDNNKNNRDLDFVKKLLKLIRDKNIPAPSPIEQRWTARSSAKMSPAYSSNVSDIFSWIGVIMYLPPNLSSNKRVEVTDQFQKYCQHLQPLIDEFEGKIHWAKIEVPQNEADRDLLRENVRKKYPVDEFNALRKVLDPNHVMTNKIIEELFD